MSEGKKVHRLEPKKVEKKVDSHEPNLGKRGQVNVPFQKFEVEEQNVEEEWAASEAPDLTGGSRWLRVGAGVLIVFFVSCIVWSVSTMFRGEEEVAVVAPVEKEYSFEELFSLRKKAVVSYFSAKTVEEKANYVRDADRVLPLMEEYYSQFPLKPASVVKVRGENPKVFKDTTLWMMHVDVNHRRVGVVVETLKDGSAKVLWELEAVHQPSDFDAFKALRKSDDHTFRVKISGAQLNGFHGFEFADYNKYRCFRIEIPKRDEYLWAYTEIGSPLDQKWYYFVTSGGRVDFDSSKSKSAIVTLRYPENSQSDRCVYLGELIQSGWLQ